MITFAFYMNSLSQEIKGDKGGQEYLVVNHEEMDMQMEMLRRECKEIEEQISPVMLDSLVQGGEASTLKIGGSGPGGEGGGVVSQEDLAGKSPPDKGEKDKGKGGKGQDLNLDDFKAKNSEFMERESVTNSVAKQPEDNGCGGKTKDRENSELSERESHPSQNSVELVTMNGQKLMLRKTDKGDHWRKPKEAKIKVDLENLKKRKGSVMKMSRATRHKE